MKVRRTNIKDWNDGYVRACSITKASVKALRFNATGGVLKMPAVKERGQIWISTGEECRYVCTGSRLLMK